MRRARRNTLRGLGVTVPVSSPYSYTGEIPSYVTQPMLDWAATQINTPLFLNSKWGRLLSMSSGSPNSSQAAYNKAFAYLLQTQGPISGGNILNKIADPIISAVRPVVDVVAKVDNPFIIGGVASIAMAAVASAAATAASTAASGAEIAPVTLPASATLLPTTVAPTILDSGAALLTMPTFDVATAATVADSLVGAINTPEMQAAIAAGSVPPVPTSIMSGAFKDWAVSTGLNVLKQQIGAQLSAAQQKQAEAAIAAEVSRMQSQWAGSGLPGTQTSLLDSLTEHPLLILAAGGAVAYLLLA